MNKCIIVKLDALRLLHKTAGNRIDSSKNHDDPEQSIPGRNVNNPFECHVANKDGTYYINKHSGKHGFLTPL